MIRLESQGLSNLSGFDIDKTHGFVKPKNKVTPMRKRLSGIL
jgi:hypothetical protein